MRILFIILILFLITSCAPSKVCGGIGGKRCVDFTQINQLKAIS